MLRVQAISGALGAEVSGVDLARPLDDAAIAILRAAWLEHIVLFFRGQNLTAEQFTKVAQYFGTPQEYPFLEGLPDHQTTTQVIKKPEEMVNFGGVWHSDTTYLDLPPMATMLIAREVPATGGDTLFANMYKAYDALSDGMKRLLGGLSAIHHSAKAAGAKTREERTYCATSARRTQNITRPNIRWCARIPKPAAKRCLSTMPTSYASRI